MNAEACVSVLASARSQRLCDLSESDRQRTVREISHVLQVAVEAPVGLVVLHTAAGWDFEVKNPSLTVGQLWELAEIAAQAATQILAP